MWHDHDDCGWRRRWRRDDHLLIDVVLEHIVIHVVQYHVFNGFHDADDWHTRDYSRSRCVQPGLLPVRP